MKTKRSITLYTVAAVTVLLVLLCALQSNSFAQVYYHDFNPDIELKPDASCGGSSYKIDIDQDGIKDYEITSGGNYVYNNMYAWFVSIKQLSSNCLFAANSYVDAIDGGSQINQTSNSWKMGIFNLCFRDNYHNIREGNWVEGNPTYIGIRININGSVHYGWIHAELEEATSTEGFRIIISDMAYNKVPGASILAGEGAPNSASNLKLFDTDNNKDGRDIYYEFEPAHNENIIQEYRLMIVNNDLYPDFSIEQANSVSENNYHRINKGNTFYSGNLFSTSTSVSGQLIQNQIPYVLYILTVHISGENDHNVLSQSSNQVILKNQTYVTTKPSLIDIDNYGDGRDFLIEFNNSGDEMGTKEYRVVLVEKVDSYELASQETVAVNDPSCYYVINSGKESYSEILAGLSYDYYKNPITNGRAYCAFVISVCDNICTDFSSLSEPSNPVRLTLPNRFHAGQKSFGEIEHTIFEPELKVEQNNVINIDVDDDRTNDITIKYVGTDSPESVIRKYTIETSGEWEFVGDELNNIIKLDKYEQLSAESSWKNGEGLFYYYDYDINSGIYTDGLWDGQSEGYLGLRLLMNEKILYAWILLDGESFNVKEKGYSLIPERFRDENLDVFPNPVTDRVYLNLSKDITEHEITISIVNTLGQVILRKEAQKFDAGIYLLELGDLHTGSGVLFLTLTNGDVSITKKIFRID